jgi:hypothetical protein
MDSGTGRELTMELKFYTVVYDMTDDGGQDISDESSFTVECDDVDDAVQEITRRSCFLFSSYPDMRPTTWISSEQYQHPYSGQYEETTCHRGSGISNADWLEILRRVQG